MSKPIICVAFTGWGGNYAKSTIQIIGRLAVNHPTLYIDYQYTIKDVFVSLFKRDAVEARRILGLRKRLRLEKLENGAEIYVLSLPPILPINWVNSKNRFRKLLNLNGRLIGGTIRRAINKLKFNDAVVVNAYNPLYGLALADTLPLEKTYYYCYDEISGSPWAEKHGPEAEKEFLSKVKGVITSSESLMEQKSEFNANAFLVKNGVDFQFFYEKTKKVKNSAPVVGYIGSLDERIDYELLRDMAQGLPDYKFKFIGRVVFPEMLKPIENVSNIELLGPKHYELLPDFLNEFDIALIPFLKTKFTKNIYPLKINEYLAMGKPVIKSDFAELPEFEGLVYTGDSANDFITYAKQALDEKDDKLIEDRIEMARSNSWEKRVKNFSEIIL